jgi:hypothetical protein
MSKNVAFRGSDGHLTMSIEVGSGISDGEWLCYEKQ